MGCRHQQAFVLWNFQQSMVLTQPRFSRTNKKTIPTPQQPTSHPAPSDVGLGISHFCAKSYTRVAQHGHACCLARLQTVTWALLLRTTVPHACKAWPTAVDVNVLGARHGLVGATLSSTSRLRIFRLVSFLHAAPQCSFCEDPESVERTFQVATFIQHLLTAGNITNDQVE